MRKRKGKVMEVRKGQVVEYLNNLVYEIANDGITYDEDAQKAFPSKEEFYEFNQDFRMYGTLFGVMYINKLIEKLDELNKEMEAEK